MDSSLDAIHRVYAENLPEGEVCSYVFRRLAELGDQFYEISPGTVAAELNWAGAQKLKAIVTALDFLSYCEEPILQRRFELWAEQGSDEVLEQPIHVFSDSEMRQGYEHGKLYVPPLGTELTDFHKRISVSYYVTEMGHKLAREEHL